MENKKTDQLSLNLDSEPPKEPQTDANVVANRPAPVISLSDEKNKRERKEEGKLYKQILNLVKHY